MIRVGDLIEYKHPENRRKDTIRVGIVEGTSRNWWCIKGHVDVNSHIIDLKRVRCVVKKRENLYDWWKYLNRYTR